MSKLDKLIAKFKEKPAKKDLTYNELEMLLNHLGFEKTEGNGARVKFIHRAKELVISIHKPHPGNILKEYVIKAIQDVLKDF